MADLSTISFCFFLCLSYLTDWMDDYDIRHDTGYMRCDTLMGHILISTVHEHVPCIIQHMIQTTCDMINNHT